MEDVDEKCWNSMWWCKVRRSREGGTGPLSSSVQVLDTDLFCFTRLSALSPHPRQRLCFLYLLILSTPSPCSAPYTQQEFSKAWSGSMQVLVNPGPLHRTPGTLKAFLVMEGKKANAEAVFRVNSLCFVLELWEEAVGESFQVPW